MTFLPCPVPSPTTGPFLTLMLSAFLAASCGVGEAVCEDCDATATGASSTSEDEGEELPGGEDSLPPDDPSDPGSETQDDEPPSLDGPGVAWGRYYDAPIEFLAAFGNGDVLTVGPALDGGHRLGRIDATGVEVWSGEIADRVYDVKVDPQDRIVAVGEIAVVMLGTDGVEQWRHSSSVTKSFPADVGVDSQGRIIVGVQHADGVAVESLDGDGQLLWSVPLLASDGPLAALTAVAVAPDGEVTVAAQYTLSPSMPHPTWIGRLASDGTFGGEHVVEQTYYGDMFALAGTDGAYALTALVVGSDPAVAGFDGDGEMQWRTGLPTGYGWPVQSGLYDADGLSNGDFVLAGVRYLETPWDAQWDVWVGRWRADGKRGWTRYFDWDTEPGKTKGVAYSPIGHVFMGGETRDGGGWLRMLEP